MVLDVNVALNETLPKELESRPTGRTAEEGQDSDWFEQAGVSAGGFEALSFDTVTREFSLLEQGEPLRSTVVRNRNPQRLRMAGSPSQLRRSSRAKTIS
jgi:hypothetical protein